MPSSDKLARELLDFVTDGGSKDTYGRTIPGAPNPNLIAELFIREMQAVVDDLRASGHIEEAAVSTLRDLRLAFSTSIRNETHIYISYERSLSRQSYYPTEYPGGIDNLVLLYDRGYRAKDYVYSGEKRSMIARSGTGHIQTAINNFMAKYGAEYGVIGVDNLME